MKKQKKEVLATRTSSKVTYEYIMSAQYKYGRNFDSRGVWSRHEDERSKTGQRGSSLRGSQQFQASVTGRCCAQLSLALRTKPLHKTERFAVFFFFFPFRFENHIRFIRTTKIEPKGLETTSELDLQELQLPPLKTLDVEISFGSSETSLESYMTLECFLDNTFKFNFD